MSANHDIIAKKPRLKKKNPLSEKIFTVVLLVALFCMFILPFYYMIISSFKSLYEAINPKPVWWPETFIWENYAKAWKMANFPKYTLNTLILSVSCSVACIVVSVPAAFALARMEFKGKGVLFAILLSSMMVPSQCVFLPVFIMFSKLGWLNTYGAMILVFTHSGATILFIRNAFKQVSNEVLEAARLDGASELTVMFKVIMPIVKPAIITQTLMIFMRRWNDLLPFQGSPFGQLGYFSNKAYSFSSQQALCLSGEGGIRTHAPLRTNGFQDRLVMTTSIPLHALFFFRFHLCCPANKIYYTHVPPFCQHFFLFFLNFFIFLGKPQQFQGLPAL